MLTIRALCPIINNKLINYVRSNLGDIVGYVYEFHNTKDYNFHLLTTKSTFTDDTVMTLAVAKWLTEDDSNSHAYLVKCMKELLVTLAIILLMK